MPDREQHKAKFIDFLNTIRRPDRRLDTLDDDKGLVTSGLIDSLALLEIIAYLESNYGVDFLERGLSAVDVNSVSKVLDVIGNSEP